MLVQSGLSDSAARVEVLAQGPVANLDDSDPPPGNDDPGPTGAGGHTGPTLEEVLSISIDTPAHTDTFNGNSSSGVMIPVTGSIMPGVGDTIKEVRVRLGNAPSVLANLEPANDWRWSAVVGPVKTAGVVHIGAKVYATDSNDNPKSEGQGRSVMVVLNDDIKPAVTFVTPTGTSANPKVVSLVDGEYSVPIDVTVSDSSGVLSGDYWDNVAMAWVPLDPNNATGHWKATATLSYQDGIQAIKVRAKDTKGNIGADLVWVRTKDTTKPTLKVKGDLTFSIPGKVGVGAVLPALSGVATDYESGVAKVQWALNPAPGQPPTNPVTSSSGKYYAKWRIENVGLPMGPNRIVVRAFDVAGNETGKVEVKIAVTEQYAPVDPTVHEYFRSLVDFVVRRLGYKGSSAINTGVLNSVLLQPFGKVLDDKLRQDSVSQLRLTVEVLRRYFDSVLTEFFDKIAEQGGDPAKGLQAKAASDAVEAAYRQEAYAATLRQLGTSIEELSAALRADLPIRRALADRLGIDLDEGAIRGGSGDNNLQQFLLAPGQFEQAKLETLFGLVDFHRDPFADPATDPVLLQLQFRRLDAAWRGWDLSAFGAVIDPDVISEQDLQPGANPALPLLLARRSWLDGLLTAMREFPTPKLTPKPLLARFDNVVSAFFGPVDVLLTAKSRMDKGEDITAELEPRQLTFAAFSRLMAVRALTETGKVVNADWEDVYAILVHVNKLRSIPAWREAEYGAGLVLGPTFFQLGPVDRDGPAPSPWRLARGARPRWRNTLQGRIERRLALRQALASAVAAVEEQTHPALRDGLMVALNPLAPASASALGRLLMIDVMAGGAVRISRVEQAIQTLQALLVRVRTGDAPDWSRVSNESQEDFDEELKWMGSYTNWYAAMQIFLFPENHLDPTLRPDDGPSDPATPSTKFRNLVSALRTTRLLTPERALEHANVFNGNEFPDDFEPPRTAIDLADRRKRITDDINEAYSGSYVDKLKKLVGSNDRREKYYFAPLAIALHLQKAGQYLAALDWYRMIYAFDQPVATRKIYYPLHLERDPNPNDALIFERNVFWLTDTLNAHDIVEESYGQAPSVRYNVHTRYVVMSIVRCLLDFADAVFVQDTNESVPRARALYLQALDLLAIEELNPKKVDGLTPNEVVTGLVRRAQIALAKIRTGRNAAGLIRQLDTVTPMTLTGGSPLVVNSGPFGSAALRAFQPTPYRYTTLIERAKQLAGLAAQVEQSYLAALEKHDAEKYNMLKARQDLALANANVTLQGLRAVEAADGVTLAQRQQERATYQIEEYQHLLDEPMNGWERKLLGDYHDALVARNWVAGLDAALTTAQAVQSAASWEKATFFGAGIPSLAAVTLLAGAKFGATVNLNDIETDIQRHSLHASVENRVREWTMQQGLAHKDEAISAAQYQVALDHQAIVDQEGFISRMQLAHAEATVAFLSNKFTNIELYQWMIDVLQDVYSYFLRQATAVAQLAQNQLAFETQQAAPVYIRKDYWQPDDAGPSDDSAKDRRGLTGSARLQQDIYQLDQFAFETNQRKLQLTKTISLARLAPAEFQAFRRTGVLPFITPMALFDQDFPGHYLRLVRQVRTSVIALVPPHQGIRATLTNGGISRAVIGGDSFQSVRLTRAPESVALTSPANSTGLFDLDAQPELMQPFELSGVETAWLLEMPKAANTFDYRTIADVLVTIDYTALASGEYRQKVIQQLDRTVQASRSYSIRDQFPDQWYDLHNPARPDAPLQIEFGTTPGDFPANVDNLVTEQLALFVVFADDSNSPVRVSLTFTPDTAGASPISGEATTTGDGIASTRIGNAPAWIPMLNHQPTGRWRLAFPDAAPVRDLLDREGIADLVLVVTYTGQTPEWPI
ncbi:hypothetical protein Rhe02_07040 [Rhizocola hellebori]|uniref:Tc toxin complex TcA C-terminal TcB-binding domain-containing protein n=1 Tax=Rhizocola hellebori TaxID=1392758 RepID=A0A8J3VDN8_9ACTN|nr:neuraminidase-like domain-containing protein [Rhizocola hellebori]GIH02637.1 hypothetical protein Rhe02_07040 [Rhizocola hellebori]